MTDNTATSTDAPATGASGALPPERVSACFGNAARVGETPRGILPASMRLVVYNASQWYDDLRTMLNCAMPERDPGDECDCEACK